MLKTYHKLVCDICEAEIADRTPASHGTINGRHVCRECLVKLNIEYRRVVHGEVPSRRGGFRQLGEYDS